LVEKYMSVGDEVILVRCECNEKENCRHLNEWIYVRSDVHRRGLFHEGGYITEAQALALRFKADWEIWSNPLPSAELQAFEAEIREYFRALDSLPCYPDILAAPLK
jgi:hypothetical protein